MTHPRHIAKKYYYELVSSTEAVSFCQCPSNSSRGRKYEPHINNRSLWEVKSVLSLFNFDISKNRKSNNSKSAEQLTGAFMTGGMLSFKQQLAPGLASTNLTIADLNHTVNNGIGDVGTFLCPKQKLNWYNQPQKSKSHNSIKAVGNFICPTQKLSSFMDTQKSESHTDHSILKKKSCLSSNNVPENNFTENKIFKKKPCVSSNNFPKNKSTENTIFKKKSCVSKNNVKGEKCFSLTEKPRKININFGKDMMSKPDPRKPFYFSWVKPFNVVKKSDKRNMVQNCAKGKVPVKVKNTKIAAQKLKKHCKYAIPQNLRTQKKINAATLSVSNQIFDKFKSHKTPSSKTKSAENITKIDINLKNSDQLFAVAKIIIEALNENIKCSEDTNIQTLSSCILFPGKMENFCYTPMKTLNKKKFNRKLTRSSNSVQFCLDRFASAFENERLNLLGRYLSRSKYVNCVVLKFIMAII